MANNDSKEKAPVFLCPIFEHLIKYHIWLCHKCELEAFSLNINWRNYSQLRDLRVKNHGFGFLTECPELQSASLEANNTVKLTPSQEQTVLDWRRLVYQKEKGITSDRDLWKELYEQLHGQSFDETLYTWSYGGEFASEVAHRKLLEAIPFLGINQPQRTGDQNEDYSLGTVSTCNPSPSISDDSDVSEIAILNNSKDSKRKDYEATIDRFLSNAQQYEPGSRLFSKARSFQTKEPCQGLSSWLNHFGLENRYLACPFTKKDPIKYSQCNFCIMEGIADVQQHLCHIHQEPIYCPRCSRTFITDEQLIAHMSLLICVSRKCPDFEKISSSQLLKIESIVNLGLTIEQQWFGIFEVIFPLDPIPKSPFITIAPDLMSHGLGSNLREPKSYASQVSQYNRPATWANELALWGVSSALEVGKVDSDFNTTDESSISDLESNISGAPSLTSSLSSIESVQSTAIGDLKWLLLQHEDLKPLYPIAISKVGQERFQQNFRRLLLRYGRALKQEARSTVHAQAARLIRFYATRIAFEINQNLCQDITSHSLRGSEEARRNLETYLKKLDGLTCDADTPLETIEGSTKEGSEDIPSSDDESVDGQDMGSLQTIEIVKSFLVSADAFTSLRDEFRHWLKLDEKTEESLDLELLHRAKIRGDEAHEHKMTKASQNTQEGIAVSFQSYFPSLNDISTQLDWLKTTQNKFNQAKDKFLESFRPELSAETSRISWTCRCGRRLYIETPKARQTAALVFAQEAAGPSNASSITIENPGSDSSSTISKTTEISATESLSINNNKASQRPISPLSSDSDEEQDPFIPAGTEKYMLLCVNTGMGLVKLANVDVTDVTSAEEVFNKLREAYSKLRGSKRRNPLVKAKTMHYIKFQLLSLSKSKECIGNYEIDSVPSRKEIMRLQYTFSPCPPLIGGLPLSKNIFMHSFLNPGDHLGPKAVEMLPKKLWRRLEWDNAAESGGVFDIPHGWGFYIIEEWDWPRIACCVFVAVVVFSLTAVLWSILLRDVQGGMGIGQYCMGVLAVSMSIIVLLGREATSMCA